MSGQQFRSINKISNWTIGWSSVSIIGTIIFISSYGPRFSWVHRLVFRIVLV